MVRHVLPISFRGKPLSLAVCAVMNQFPMRFQIRRLTFSPACFIGTFNSDAKDLEVGSEDNRPRSPFTILRSEQNGQTKTRKRKCPSPTLSKKYEALRSNSNLSYDSAVPVPIADGSGVSVVVAWSAGDRVGEIAIEADCCPSRGDRC